jgi:hypothetical protein
MPQEFAEARINGHPCLINDGTYKEAARKANSYRCPVGFEPGVAYVLVTRRIFMSLSRTSPLSLTCTAGDNTLTFGGLYLNHGWSVSKGHNADNDRAYLVQLLDKRAKMFGATDKAFNVPLPAPATDDKESVQAFYEDTLDNGGVFTWDNMVRDLWEDLPAEAGSFPGLPYAPHDRPTDFRFHGWDTWEAIEVVLTKLGCTVALHPFTGRFAIVKLGASQPGFRSAMARHPLRMQDAAPLGGTAVYPAAIRVFFHRIYRSYGTERTTPREGNIAAEPAYSMDIATGIAGASGVLPIWDDLPAWLDFDGSISNTADLNQRAQQVRDLYVARVGAHKGRVLLHGLEAGLIPGSQVKTVWWRNFGDGWLTESNLAPLPRQHAGRHAGVDPLRPATWPRPSTGMYPPQMHLIQMDRGAPEPAEPESDNLISAGRLLRYNPEDGGSWEPTDEYVWVKCAGRPPVYWFGTEEIFGRLCGSWQHEDQWRPLYIVDSSPDEYLAITLTAMSAGGTCSVRIRGDQGQFIGAVDLHSVQDWLLLADDAIEAGTRVIVKRYGAMWYIVNAKCESAEGDDDDVDGSPGEE